MHGVSSSITTAFLDEERATLERFMPGFDGLLAQTPLHELEASDSGAIEMFRDAAGPGLLVPADQEGLGADAHEAIRVQRAIGARCPSLAVASTMHHFSVASLLEVHKAGGEFEWLLLEAIATERRLVASGFAEGMPGQGVLAPTMRARRDGTLLRVSGAKQPCSLSRSMDLLTASVLIEDGDGAGSEELAVAVIASDAPGIEVRPFWEAPVLTGAQSDAVVLTDVPVEEDLLVRLDSRGDGGIDEVHAVGFVWFELLITASYLGMASALVEKALAKGGTATPGAVAAAVEIEASMAALDGLAGRLEIGASDPSLLWRALAGRYAAQDAINRAVATAVEALGGMGFIKSPDVPYLASASRALAFHPPSRTRTTDPLADALKGGELAIE